jgi:hypothetical protein
METQDEGSSKPRQTLTSAAVLAVLIVGFFAYTGNFHFIYGHGLTVRKIHKVSWSLSEMFIDAEELSATPPLLLPVKYPLFVMRIPQGE